MIEKYLNEIKQCLDRIATIRRMNNSRIRECIAILELDVEEIFNEDLEEIRKVLWEVIE